jgi:signal peptidase
MDTFETLTVELLERKHSIRFKANGSSMRPFILDGDSVEIQPVNHPDFKRGDIVFYQLSSGRFLVHRVVQVHDHRLLIHGDANLEPDGWVDPDQVMGMAVAAHRKGKRIDLTSAWRTGTGRLWVIFTPLRCRLQPWLQIIWRKFRGGIASA